MSSTSSAADGAQTAPAAAGSSTGLSAQEQEWKDDPELAFETGVELAFERWDVLNMSVENGWCRGGVDRGEQMRDDLINATIEWFLTSKEKLHWDDVSEYLYDALLNEFHVDAQDQSEEQLARLLCRLHDDCLARGDFSGLHKLQQTRKAAHRAKEEARRQTKVDMRDEDDEEEEEEEEEGGEDGEAFDERDEEEEAKREEGALDGAMESLAVRDSASSTEGKEEAEAAQAAAQPPAEDDGWTTVGSSKPQRSKRRGK